MPEREAARQIQQVLLPDRLDQSPDFTVECAYCPAEQVGGDFFQQIADDDGGMTIVIGDVSGKGLAAATMVSLLVGAIRAEASHGANPATLLAALNERMMGRSRGGFTTCLAARFSSTGLMTVANAGHLPRTSTATRSNCRELCRWGSWAARSTNPRRFS